MWAGQTKFPGPVSMASKSDHEPELSTGRIYPPVGSGHDFAEFWRVGSGRQHFGFFSFLLIFLDT